MATQRRLLTRDVSAACIEIVFQYKWFKTDISYCKIFPEECMGKVLNPHSAIRDANNFEVFSAHWRVQLDCK